MDLKNFIVLVSAFVLIAGTARADAPAADAPAAEPRKPTIALQPVKGSVNRLERVPTAAQVRDAMRRAVDYLLSQKKDDNFETHDKPWTGKNDGGETAIVTYALLHAGRSLNDARLTPTSAELKPALKYLANLEQDGTYAAALTALALNFNIKSPENKQAFRNAYEYLSATLNGDPKATKESGGFSYNAPLRPEEILAAAQNRVEELKKELAAATKSRDPADIKSSSDALALAKKDLAYKTGAGKKLLQWSPSDGSNTQYGVLGLWAMADYGIEIPDAQWSQVDGYWRRNQQADGGWAYSAGTIKAGKGSTPTMSIAGLASLMITAQFLDNQVRLEPQNDPAIEHAIKHVTKEFTGGGDLYYMYGVARVGLASGMKFFGQRNWYRDGAADLLHGQDKQTGAWNFWGHRTIGTSYGLLFLARGRNPVPFNKLRYDGPWNARPRDDANLAAWMGKGYEKEFNWQVVSTEVEPEEWMDAPILLITGSKPLNLKPEERAKIRKFVDMGGMIFSTSDCNGGAFDLSVRKLQKEMFAQYPAMAVKKESALVNGELGTKPIRDIPQVIAVHNGTRYLWVHTPEDMGASWQSRNYTKGAHFSFPLNLYFYAVGLNTSRTKLDDPVVYAGDKQPRSTLRVAKLALGTNSDPEPGAWVRAAQLARADLLMDVQVSTAKPADLPASKPALVALTGTDAFVASVDDISALQSYLHGGGTLFADAAGGNRSFTTSFVELAHAIYPECALEEVSLNDPLFKGMESVDYRRYSKKLRGRSGDWKSLRMHGIRERGRWVVLFSEYDITSGLLGTETWGIDGYTADSSEGIVEHLLQYVKSQVKKGV